MNGDEGSNKKNWQNQQPQKVCRGVRGAVTVDENSREAIVEATRQLLETVTRLNDMALDDIASVYFTTTTDLDAAYPAVAARELGWFDVALLCAHEMNVDDGLSRCIRVLIHWNTTLPAKELRHVYLRGAKVLRPDLASRPLVRPYQANHVKTAVNILAQSL